MIDLILRQWKTVVLHRKREVQECVGGAEVKKGLV